MEGYSARTDKQISSYYMSLDQPDDQVQVEYIWIDGTGEGIRSKCKTMDFEPKKPQGTSNLWAATCDFQQCGIWQV